MRVVCWGLGKWAGEVGVFAWGAAGGRGGVFGCGGTEGGGGWWLGERVLIEDGAAHVAVDFVLVFVVCVTLEKSRIFAKIEISYLWILSWARGCCWC